MKRNSKPGSGRRLRLVLLVLEWFAALEFLAVVGVPIDVSADGLSVVRSVCGVGAAVARFCVDSGAELRAAFFVACLGAPATARGVRRFEPYRVATGRARLEVASFSSNSLKRIAVLTR